MNEKRFVCIDIGYGEEWYITDNGERLSEMEIVNLLNEQDEKINELEKRLNECEKFRYAVFKRMMELSNERL